MKNEMSPFFPKWVPFIPPMTGVLMALLLVGFFTSGMTCRKLDPGADPLVVRTEQVESGAQATFLLALRIDNLDRGFWKTNAPAFHSYCGWLREPKTYQVTNLLPQYRVILLHLDDVKTDYKSARSSSNDLFTALSTIESLANQAGAWLTIVTNQPQGVLP